MKKVIALIMAILMVVTMLTSCSGASTHADISWTDDANSNDVEILKAKFESNYYMDWNDVALSEYATETVLIALAEKCSGIDNNDEWAKTIASSICDNPNATAKAVGKLLESRLYDVASIGRKKLESMQ